MRKGSNKMRHCKCGRAGESEIDWRRGRGRRIESTLGLMD